MSKSRFKIIASVFSVLIILVSISLILFSPSISAQESTPQETPSPTPHLEPTPSPIVPMIIGGDEAQEGQFPWVAALVRKNVPNARDGFLPCGGSLIHREWVLTAGHCVVGIDKNNPNIQVVLGRVRLSSSTGERIDVERIITHPKYNEHSLEYDGALLKLKTPSSQPTIKLGGPQDSGLLTPGKLGFVAGWGRTEFASTSDTLRYVGRQIISNQICKEVWRDNVTDRKFCAGYAENGDICYGDSGGPFIVLSDNQWVQVGINSWSAGYKCAEPGKYSGHARISELRNWIESITPLGEIQLNVNTGLGHSSKIDVIVAKSGRDHLFRKCWPTQTGNITELSLKTISSIIPPGTYDVYIKPQGYKRQKTTRLLSSGQNTINLNSFEAGDIDNNNYVNVGDLLLVLRNWGPGSSPADVNRDGLVNVNDLLEVLKNWGPGEGQSDSGDACGVGTFAVQDITTMNTLPSIPNSNFELGPNGSWTEASTNFGGQGSLIWNSGLPFTPWSGSWLAWLGGADNETSKLSQTVTLPATGPIYLHYQYQILSGEDSCNFDTAAVLLNSTSVKQYNLCKTNNTSDWTLGTLDISSYAGQTITLHFHTETDFSISSSFFVDDILLTNSPQPPGTLPTIANDDFELGPNGGWAESSTNFSGLIWNPGLFLAPWSGSFVAWLGDANNEISDLSQTLSLPSNGPIYLHYRYQIRSDESGCSFDVATILVNSTQERLYQLCQSNNTSEWILDTIDLSGYAGQTVTIHFHTETDASIRSNFFVDDVLLSDTPIAPARILLTPSTGTFNVNNTFNVQVVLDTGGHAVEGIDVIVRYDPNVLRVQDSNPNQAGVQVTPGNQFVKFHHYEPYPNIGEVHINATKDDYESNPNIIGDPFEGRGTVATITLKAIASINNTAMDVYFQDGWVSESNVLAGNGLDVLKSTGTATFQITGSPSRIMPTISFTPNANSILNSSAIKFDVQTNDNQVKEVRFDVKLGNVWTTMGSDIYSEDGWNFDWDASLVPDGNYQMRATALLLGGEGSTAVNSNITLDRKSPLHVSSTITPTSVLSPGIPIMIEVSAADQETNVDYIEVYAQLAGNIEHNEPWSLLGSISGNQGSLVWDTSNLANGIYQIGFDIYDVAGNRGPDSHPQLFVGIGSQNPGNNQAFLPIILKGN